MIQAYNFLGSWQLFPEKGSYEWGERPQSGIYKVESVTEARQLLISHNWVTISGQAFTAEFAISLNSGLNDFEDHELADKVQAIFPDSISFEIHFYKKGQAALHVIHEIMPNGYLKITQQGFKPD